MTYFILKYLHIVSSTLLFGTGLGSAFYMWQANKSQNFDAMLYTAKAIVIADWVFTTPAVIIQPITGLWLMHLLHYPLTSSWILWSLALYMLAGACWLPVVYLQIKMRKQLMDAASNKVALNASYYFYSKIWFLLGWPAFTAVLVIFYLMVFKPL